MSVTDFDFEQIPDRLKQHILDAIIQFAEKMLGSQISEKIRDFFTNVVISTTLDQALQQAVMRFEQEYIDLDEDVTAYVLRDQDFWNNGQVHQTLFMLITHPESFDSNEQTSIVATFDSVLPWRINRERVNRAISYFLRIIAQEVWLVPGAKDVYDIAMLHGRSMGFAEAQERIVNLRASLQTPTHLDVEVRDALLQLITEKEQELQTKIPPEHPVSRPYSNLPPSDYGRFVGRERELAWLRQRLAPRDRAWQIALVGKSGVGKSALAHAIATSYCEQYAMLSPAERFEAVIWFSCKDDVLTPRGKESGRLLLPTFRTLQDIYTTIAQTLEREDITRASPTYQVDMYDLYEEGLNELLKRFGHGHRYYDKVLVYAQRLTENIEQSRRYGDTLERSTRRNEIIDQLNALASFALGTSFNNICNQVIPAGSEEQDRLVQRALMLQRTLIIVDNLERSTDPRVRPFLRNLPAPTRVIVTSQEPVPSADMLLLNGMLPDEAEQLIAEEAEARSMMLSEWQRRRIFDLTAGQPLAIKFSLTRISNGESFNAVARWLSNATNYLTEYCISGQIDLIRECDPLSWRLLMVCAIFDQNIGASRGALGYVIDVSDEERDKSLKLLEQFSLVNRTENDRFWLLPCIQRYAGMALDNLELREKVIDRWLSWLVDFSKTYGLNDLQVEQIHTFETEYLNLRLAIRLAQKQERWRSLLQIAEKVWYYPYLVGLHSDVQEILIAAINAAQTLGDEPKEGRFKRRCGEIARIQGQYTEALNYLNDAETIAQRYGDDIGLVFAWQIRLRVLQSQGRFSEAEHLARTTLKIAEQLDNTELKVWAICRLFEFDTRFEWLERAESWARELGWSRALAWIILQKAETLLQQEDLFAAEPLFEQSLRMAESWVERPLIADSKRYLAQVYMLTGRPALARNVAKEARDLYERVGMTTDVVEMEEVLKELEHSIFHDDSNPSSNMNQSYHTRLTV